MCSALTEPTLTEPTPGHPPQSQTAASHNLLGQRLGRKGRDTRERILAAMARLMSKPGSEPVSLSAVAREASVGMTTLYLYFADLGELLLSALEPVIADIGSFNDLARFRWPDDRLEACCIAYVEAHYAYWARHARLLHMRNSFADANDVRFLRLRVRASAPQIANLVRQMDGDVEDRASPCLNLAVVLITGIERLTTASTNPNFPIVAREAGLKLEVPVIAQLHAKAHILMLVIQDQRTHHRSLCETS
ncbi:TetR/AcrR family transcriptional regulator [uncultured Sphingomonas sp.]|uniref:TetR/AcrR family transcriptional regulator n=1 Tax=uncultured Sphingomonas sp. TaxID=158754 RepID=UPI0035CB8F3B